LLKTESLIYILYILSDMRSIKTTISNKIEVKNIKGYFEHKVTKFGTGAKIDCPKEYLDCEVVVLVRKKRA
jgi:putative transposon-encoded protein